MVKKETSFIDLKQVKIDDPFFSRVQNVVIHTMLPYQERVLHDEVSGIRKSHVIKNFRIAAGDEKGTYYGRIFQDSDLAKWLEAVAYSLTVEANPELEAHADAIIDLIGRAQQPDGYLDTYFIAAEPEHKWQNLTDCHEMYCAGHMTEAGVAYYQATGKTKLLDICCKLCGLSKAQFITGKASLSTFMALFQPFCNLIKGFCLIIAFYHVYRIVKILCIVCCNQSLLFCHTFAVFFFHGNIRIIIKYCDFKILSEIFQTIAATGCATTVQQKTGCLFPCTELLDYFIQFLLIITYLIHSVYFHAFQYLNIFILHTMYGIHTDAQPLTTVRYQSVWSDASSYRQPGTSVHPPKMHWQSAQ